jgi:hypothetical protein
MKIEADGERAIQNVCDLGRVYPGETLSAAFRVRNVSSLAATLDDLDAFGPGFELTPAARLPVSIPPGGAMDFTVRFQASGPGIVSAGLRGTGISGILAVTVAPRLTYLLESGADLATLTGAIDFSAVERGSAKVTRFVIENRMEMALAVPTIAAAGAGFALAGASPSGNLLRPGDRAEFAIEFRAGEEDPAGVRSGSLSIGDRSYSLTAAVTDPPPPVAQPGITISAIRSAQQGSVTVTFDSEARAAGSGTLTLDFHPAVQGATDPDIAFASGGRAAPFTFGRGDSQGKFAGQNTVAFQTGSTAGTLVFKVELGGVSRERSLTIPAESVAVASAEAVRGANGIEVRIGGIDNTRTAGALAFTFFDAAGNALAPGVIRADASTAFSSYFASSAVGGSFLLKAAFPISGDAASIAAFTVEISNSAGLASTARTAF